MYDYRGTTALVTGATKGIGRSIAVELARRGANLVLVARGAAALDDLAAELPVTVLPLAADLADPAAAAALPDRVAAAGVTVDLLVNNAGLGHVGPFFGRPLDRNLGSVAVNIDALLTLTHRLGGDMVTRGRGGIINIDSTAAFQPMPYQASYAATKAFVLSFTEAITEELRGTPVRVLAVHPGATRTGFFDGTTGQMDPRVQADPDRVAARILDDFARGRTHSYPGIFFDRPSTWLARLLPRGLTARVAGQVTRRLGLHEAVETAA